MYRDEREQLRIALQSNEALHEENLRLRSDLAYVAMMADVDIDDEEGKSDE